MFTIIIVHHYRAYMIVIDVSFYLHFNIDARQVYLFGYILVFFFLNLLLLAFKKSPACVTD